MFERSQAMEASSRDPVSRAPLRVVVATVVHNPEDARIRHRQIRTLLDAGHEVTYIAPAGDQTDEPRLRRVVIPQAQGRSRLGSLRAARRSLRAATQDADVTIIHDPELVLAADAISGPRIWDVHEDVVAQVGDKAYIPKPLAPLARAVVGALVNFGSRSFDLLIAEHTYAERHPDATLVRNTVRPHPNPPPSGSGRAVYLGRVSTGRGLALLNSVAEELPASIDLEIIGPADPGLFISPRAIATGFLPNDEALSRIAGATVGLSLLQDTPNYRISMPTKILEYLANGVPVITTPLPQAVSIVERHSCGVVVPFNDPSAVVDAIIAIGADDDLRARLAHNGHAAVRERFNWSHDGQTLLETVAHVASRSRKTIGKRAF